MHNVHNPDRTWLFKEEVEYSVPYAFIEYVFLEQARKEELVGFKEKIIIKSLETNDKERKLTLFTETHKASEN
jgi:hypothetical protein